MVSKVSDSIPDLSHRGDPCAEMVLKISLVGQLSTSFSRFLASLESRRTARDAWFWFMKDIGISLS